MKMCFLVSSEKIKKLTKLFSTCLIDNHGYLIFFIVFNCYHKFSLPIIYNNFGKNSVGFTLRYFKINVTQNQ